MQEAGLFAPDSAAATALTRAGTIVEAAHFERLQADALLRLRGACVGAPEWSDATDGGDAVMIGAPAAHSPAEGRSALGWTGASALSGGQCVVWRGAQRVAEALEGEVAALHGSDDSLRCGAACKTLEDAADLYRVLVAAACQPYESARKALVHTNSLRYLADAVTLLPLTLPPDATAREPLVAAAAASAAVLAGAAAEEQAQFVERFAARVVNTIDALPDLRGLKVKAGLDARKSVQRACKALRSVSEALARACTPEMHVALYAAALGRVCAAAASKVLALQDISPQDCDDIHGVLEPLWTDPVAAAAAHLASGVDGAPPGLPGWTAADAEVVLRGACEGARKLAAVGYTLKARMADIAEAWEGGELRGAGLGAGDVVHMLRAVFEDNPHQRQCIARVRAVS